MIQKLLSKIKERWAIFCVKRRLPLKKHWTQITSVGEMDKLVAGDFVLLNKINETINYFNLSVGADCIEPPASTLWICRGDGLAESVQSGRRALFNSITFNNEDNTFIMRSRFNQDAMILTAYKYVENPNDSKV